MTLQKFEVKALIFFKFFTREAKNVDQQIFELKMLAKFDKKFQKLIKLAEASERKNAKQHFKILQNLKGKLESFTGNFECHKFWLEIESIVKIYRYRN